MFVNYFGRLFRIPSYTLHNFVLNAQPIKLLFILLQLCGQNDPIWNDGHLSILRHRVSAPYALHSLIISDLPSSYISSDLVLLFYSEVLPDKNSLIAFLIFSSLMPPSHVSPYTSSIISLHLPSYFQAPNTTYIFSSFLCLPP